MQVQDAIKSRSSTRGYAATKLTEAEIAQLVEAGLQAPTATNRQEIHFTVLQDGNPILQEIEAEKNRLWNTSPAQNFYYSAPTVIIISAEKGFRWSAMDAGIAVENIALAAEALGLGNVIIGCIHDALRGERREYFEKLLQFPENYEYQIAIAVGHKATSKEPHDYDAQRQVTYL